MQKVEDGEPLGGAKSRAEDDFSDISDLDLPFDEPGAPVTAAKPTVQKGTDILDGINFDAA